MSDIEQEQKGEVLQCRSCKRTFHQSEIKTVNNEQLGVHRIDRVCPYCDSNTYGLLDYPVSEEELIYKNGKFYLHNGKQIKKCIDRAIYKMI